MKIRMDFVTNSSSSSFVAFGILSDELAEFIKRLVKEDYAYSKWCVGEMITDTWDGMVTVVTTMDFYGDYYVYGSDEYDNRTDKQKERDDKKANTEWNIIKKINLFLPTMTEEETEKINQMISDAVANGKTVARTYISETDGYSYPYFREIDFLKMQDKKTSAKWLGELLEKADAMHVETTKKPQTLRAFARSLKISESTLSALIQKVYSKNAEEWLHENKYIIGKEEKLELLLKQADEKFEKCGKRPESMRQFVLENGSTKYISDLIMSVHNRQAEEWLIEKGYIVYVSDEEKLSEYLKRADEDFERTKKRPETASEFYNIVEDYYAFTFSRLIHKLYHESPANWLIENGYVVPLSKEEKLAEILAELKKRYPEGSELPGDLKEFHYRNRDLKLDHVKDYYGINLRDWLITNGLLLSNADVRKAKKRCSSKRS